jgi:hypothetical protein
MLFFMLQLNYMFLAKVNVFLISHKKREKGAGDGGGGEKGSQPCGGLSQGWQ